MERAASLARGENLLQFKEALDTGVRKTLDALGNPAPRPTILNLSKRLYEKWRGPVTPQRHMLRVGVAAVASVLLCVGAVLALVAYAILELWKMGYPLVLPYLLLSYCLAEYAFSKAWKRKYDRFNQIPNPHAPQDPSFDPRSAYDEFIVHQKKISGYISLTDMIRTWFWHAPMDQIKRGNVGDLILYGFFYKSRQQMEAEGQGHIIEELVDELEDAWGIKFEPGYNTKLEFMAHLWQPIRCSYRPMAFYILIEFMFFLKHVVLVSLGFRPFKHLGFKYYVYGELPIMHGWNLFSRNQKPKGEFMDSSQVPILFLHGVGVGLMPYIGFIAQLAVSGQPIIAFECNHLGMRWVSHIPDADEVVRGIVGMLQKHSVPRACVSGHSYGTFHASRLLKLHPHLVQSICLIDPVNFNMFTGKLIQNFVYCPNKKTNRSTCLVARDIHHATSVSRRFYWSVINLWPQQLPRYSLIVLSGRDELVPVPETINMLYNEAPQAVVMFRPSHKHAQFIKDPELQKQVVSELLRILKNAEDYLHKKHVRAVLRGGKPDMISMFTTPEKAKADPICAPTTVPHTIASVGTLQRTDSGRVFVELVDSSPDTGTKPGQAHPHTVLRTVGSKGVIALQRQGLEFLDDTCLSRQSLSRQGSLEALNALGGHSRQRSRSSLDLGSMYRRDEMEGGSVEDLFARGASKGNSGAQMFLQPTADARAEVQGAVEPQVQGPFDVVADGMNK